jgi:hypothetical protein
MAGPHATPPLREDTVGVPGAGARQRDETAADWASNGVAVMRTMVLSPAVALA